MAGVYGRMDVDALAGRQCCCQSKTGMRGRRMVRLKKASQQGIEAASATYKKCTSMLQDELGLQPIDLGLGPRASFEETVTLLRANLQRKGAHDATDAEELTEDDFSFNEILRLMRLTALKLARPKRYFMDRETFIREVNFVLQEEAGLRVAKKLFPNAETGRYAWIEGHMPVFLRRHKDVVRRSDKQPHNLKIVCTRPDK